MHAAVEFMMAVNGNKVFLDAGLLGCCAGLKMEAACLQPEEYSAQHPRRPLSRLKIVVETSDPTLINCFEFFVRDCFRFRRVER